MDYNYWRYECTMSRDNLSDVLYATLLCGGSITSTFTIHAGKEYNRRQNARNMAGFKIKLPEGERADWEDIVGEELKEPRKIQLN